MFVPPEAADRARRVASVRSRSMSESLKAPVGEAAPDFTLPQSGDGTVSLSSYRGRPVVLAFLRGYA